MVEDICDTAKDKLKSYADELGLSQDAISTGYHLIDDFQKKKQDFNPEEIAAGAAYFGAILVGERKTQKDVGKVAELTTIKVGKSYREIMDNVDVDIIL